MASLKAARCAMTPGLRQFVGFSSARPLTASLRPHLIPKQTIGARNFSVGAFVNSSVEATAQAVVSLHSMNATGNWTGTIVFSALIVALARMPLQMVARRIIRQQRRVPPFEYAWRHEVQGTRLSRSIQVAQIRKRLLKERGCQDWKTWAPALGVPVWYLMSEALRRLCGSHGGILSLLTGNYKDNETSASVASASVSEQASTAASSSTEAVSSSLDSLSSVAEEMANGGILWFTDLTVADPTLLLPVMLMGTLGWSMFPTGKMRNHVFDIGKSQEFMPPGLKWRVRLRRGLLVTAILIPAVCLNLPAGIFVYWISSMLFGQISGKIMEKLYGKEHVFQPAPVTERFSLRSW
ncbi:hypothetical protein CORC01_07018 [Colletotrichum orchidophilum]|uniref:YidC/Oxa1 family membrane protein insertase n=1 Tax=Colletotrichum orchidophilum TaxID=1209926 RepID=A0A1G4B8G0_9PEZI|nr:uncharacterized protein CORC01_07018 [Colletotrichum orchidophilum]OHE97603.1 hypothetical protein CORC01_07018 [Colletotrichum orchidophilum]